MIQLKNLKLKVEDDLNHEGDWRFSYFWLYALYLKER